MLNNNKFRLTGILGNPLRQSMSPTLHNFWISKYKINSYYCPLEVKDLRNIDKALKKLNFLGVNVTIPFKKSIIKYLDEIDETSRNLNAVNTVINREGKLIGLNTDIKGFEVGLKKAKGWSKNKPVLVLGAGGAAEAIVYSLIGQGAKNIYITNRTKSKADKLSDKYPVVKSKNWLDYEIVNNSGLIVNTTSLGMIGYPKLKISLNNVKKDTIIYDIVYNPLNTGLIKEANKYNLLAIKGLDMFIGQAIESFKLWFKETPVTNTNILVKLKKMIGNK